MFDWIYFLAPNLKQLGGELLTCLGQTFTMIGVSGILSWILGILVGVLLVTCRPGGILENRPLFTIFDRGIDIIRSIPFIILIVLLALSGRYRFRRDGELRCARFRYGAFLCASDRIGALRN